jgi:UDP-N-acetylglucosamine transferase subunit ALG13
MILVTVGTNEARFDRLLLALEAIDFDEDVVVQHGPSPIRPAGAECFEFLPFERLVDHMRAARVVVTHAGVGSVMTALSVGKRPIVMARLRRFQEAVDDHQLAFARNAHRAGLVTLVDDVDGLAEAVLHAGAESKPFANGAPHLATELNEYLHDRIRARGSSSVGPR